MFCSEGTNYFLVLYNNTKKLIPLLPFFKSRNLKMTTELPDILNSIRKDLHSEIDRVFTNGSQSIYAYLTKKLEETHAQQLKEIYDRLDKLSAPAPTPAPVPVAEPRIPEVYFTNVNINEAVQNIEIDAEDGTVHEDDDVLTVHDDVSHSEIIDVVDQEQDTEMSIEAEPDHEEVIEDQAELDEPHQEVVEDDADQIELEQEPEDNSESLNEIEVDGVAYYYDSNGDVWGLNEDSEPVAIIGKYNETDGEFELFSQDGDQEPEGLQCEEFTYKGRTYLKDDDNNVYTTEGEETGYKFLNNKLVKVA